MEDTKVTEATKAEEFLYSTLKNSTAKAEMIAASVTTTNENELATLKKALRRYIEKENFDLAQSIEYLEKFKEFINKVKPNFEATFYTRFILSRAQKKPRCIDEGLKNLREWQKEFGSDESA